MALPDSDTSAPSSRNTTVRNIVSDADIIDSCTCVLNSGSNFPMPVAEFSPEAGADRATEIALATKATATRIQTYLVLALISTYLLPWLIEGASSASKGASQPSLADARTMSSAARFLASPAIEQM
jgi:hypothetical protein